MSNFTAIFRLVASATGFQSTINSAKGAIGSLGSKLGDGLKGQIGKVFSVSGAFTMLKGTMEEVLNRAKQYNNLGQRMGIPAAEVQKLDKAAERAGINVSSLGRGMMLVQKFGSEALGGATEKGRLLTSQLGATKEQLKVMSAGGKEGLVMLSSLMQNVGTEAERDAIGIKVLGEKWFELKQFIEMGPDAIKKAGDDQTTWNQDTQNSLSRVQRAWANMWNDISVETANFMDDIEPVVGILRFIFNIIMTLIRIPIYLLGQALDGIQAALIGSAWAMAKLFGDDESANKLAKMFDKKATEIENRNKKMYENIDKDSKGGVKGIQMIFGMETGEESVVKDKKDKSTDTRTAEERQAYEQALKKQNEATVATELANAKEEQKLFLLKKQLEIMKLQEEELKKKHPEKYRETADYLELQKKLAEQERKISLQKRKDDKALYEAQVDAANFSNDRRLARMKAADATEEEIFREQIRQQKEEAVRLSEELIALRADEAASDEERRKKAMELVKSVARTEDMIFAQKKKENEQELGPAVTSSLQAIGGGGAVAVATTATKQLMETEETNRLLSELVQIAQKGNLAGGSMLGGTYSPPKP